MGSLAWIPKFILAPVAAVALGYFVVGPKLSEHPKLNKLIGEHLPGHKASTPTESPTTSTSASPAPQTSVDVKPIAAPSEPNDEEKPKPKRRRRRRSTPPKKTEAEAPTAPTEKNGPDPASTPDA